MESTGKGEAQENFEAMVSLARGPKGEQGDEGKRGEQGLSRLQGRAVVVLFAIAVGLAVFAIFWVSHAVRASSSQQQQQAAAEQAAQRAQGAALERKLCATLDPLAGLASLKPPAGNPADNPSRAYEQELSAKLAPLAQLAPDLGCKAAK